MLDLANVTLTDNTVPGGVLGGAAVFNDEGSTASYRNVLFDGDCVNQLEPILNDLGGNHESPGEAPNQCLGSGVANLGLLPLADNGGTTPTHSLSPTSPALDGGVNEGCEPFDQRGATRPVDGDGVGEALCDSGALELGAEPGPVLIFRGDFESAGFGAWSSTVPQPG